jgi:hypothetical protein
LAGKKGFVKPNTAQEPVLRSLSAAETCSAKLKRSRNLFCEA